MVLLYGTQYTKIDLLKRVGDISQIAGATRFEYADGKAKGTAAIEVKNGAGLRFVVLPDRGMDIAYAECGGFPVSYISKTGVVNPAHYSEPDFLRSFTGGLLTTCGLTYMGAPCVDEGVSLGAHGRIANTPAFDVCVRQEWVEDNYVIEVSGKVRESTVFGEDVVLKRTISTKLGENAIRIHDEIENCGFTHVPLMVLYHLNFGFPLISEHTVLETNATECRPRDNDAKTGLGRECSCSAPIHGFKEQVFYRNAAKYTYARLSNLALGMSVSVQFDGGQLPYLVEWKQMGEQEYVMGLEPATYPPDGRAKARERGELELLPPQKTKAHDLLITF